MAVEEIMASIVVAILGAALVTWLAILARRAVTRQRELAAKRSAISSEQELDEFLRRVRQATDAGQLDRLERERKDEN